MFWDQAFQVTEESGWGEWMIPYCLCLYSMCMNEGDAIGGPFELVPPPPNNSYLTPPQP